MHPSERLRRLVRLPARAKTIRTDVDAEIAYHLETTERELVASGMSPDDARREARRRFGDVERIRVTLRKIDRHGTRRRARGDFWNGWGQDLRRSIRSLGREPAFAAVVAITLALGLGANATMFRVIDRLLLRPAPYVRNDGTLSLLYFQQETPQFGRVTFTSQSYPAYERMREQTANSGDLAAWWSASTSSGEGGDARKVQVVFVTPNLFPILGVRAWGGRLFDPAQWDAEPVPTAVLTHSFATATYGDAAAAIGKTIPIGGTTYTITGVTPPGFVGADLRKVDIFLTMPTAVSAVIGKSWRTNRNMRWLQVVSRRAAGVTPQQAGSALTTALQTYGRDNAKGDSTVTVLAGSIVRARRPDGTATARIALWLSGVAILVLLVACSNVANLLLARAIRRRRELAVHLALGVSRGRLTRTIVTESLLLGGMGGVLALALSVGGDKLLRATLLADIPLEGSAIDARLGVFVVLLVVLSALSAGTVPAVVASATPLVEALKSGARESGGRRHSLRTALVVVQGTLSVILLVGAGLFVRSFARATSADLGFVASGLLVAAPDVDAIARNPDDAEQRWKQVVEALRAVPGVASVAQSVTVPFESQMDYKIVIDGDSLPPPKGGGPYVNGVSADYFRTMGSPIRRGRDFTESDAKGSPRVAIINEAMAAQVWPGRDPIGQCFGVESTEGCVSVVGIVPNARMTEIADVAPQHYYIPISQWQPPFRSLMVRLQEGGGEGRGGGVAAVRRAILAVEPSLPYVDVRPMSEIVDSQVRSWKLGATMFTLFGGLGLVVAALGLYSVIAHDVSQRRREIGVRMALGASRENVARLVVGSGVRQALAGMVLGLAIAWGVSTRVSDLLFETSPRDPLIYGGVVALLLLVALLASFIPARRASKLDPADVLRDS